MKSVWLGYVLIQGQEQQDPLFLISGLKMVMGGEGEAEFFCTAPPSCYLLRNGGTLLICDFPCQLRFCHARILTSALEPYLP